MTLSIRNIVRCKCVCKSWRDLIKEDDEFATSCTPKPCLAFVHENEGFNICNEACEPHFQFDLPPPYSQYPTHEHHRRVVIDSTSGLLLVWDGVRIDCSALFICNPMTLEFVELPPLPTSRCIFGFGVSNLNRKFKILCCELSGSCHVYTLGGEGAWRSIDAPPSRLRLSVLVSRDTAAFLNGNLHWLAIGENYLFICCFNLETELFSCFSLPHGEDSGSNDGKLQLRVLEDRLCLCSNLFSDNRIVIWRMNDYGNDKAWVEFLSSPKMIERLRVC
ncbi:putative F-box protein At1g33530 [Salvia hispanica]|uniref:putative F-box protein At1g33530 n=1 Tax=Salvia hispanica TaxID=49212 RepID=UPI002009BFEB|nr:putative F-box protein At1g33530 [Salvia hispanica]